MTSLNPDWVEACEALCPPVHRKLSALLERVCKKYAVCVEDVLGLSRKGSICLARREFCGRAKRELNKSYPEIAAFLGNRDHVTVLRAVQKYEGTKVQ